MRSNVIWKNYLYEILHETNLLESTFEFPENLIIDWAYRDICDTILQLGESIIGPIYRTSQLFGIEGSTAILLTASHEENSKTVTVSGASLEDDYYIGATLMTTASGIGEESVIYYASVVDNTNTTITISNGSLLPEFTNKTILLIKAGDDYYVNMSVVNKIYFPKLYWKVTREDGTNIPYIPPDMALNIQDNEIYGDECYYYEKGEKIVIVGGPYAQYPSTVYVGYYELPHYPASIEEDYVDFPIEYHSLSQLKTIIRVLKKKGLVQLALEKEKELELQFKSIKKE